MSKQLQLTIPKPCHENWDNMTPVQQGKFCGSCQKQVVDFSNMSDRLVAEFFKKPSTGSVCGRFMTDQLERDIEIPKKRIPWLKYFFQFAIPAFLISIKASAQKTQGKIRVSTVTKDTLTKPMQEELMTVGMLARPTYIKPAIKNTVVKPVKEPVVTMKGDIAVKVVADTIIKEPVCTRTMGIIAIPDRPIHVEESIVGKVIDEKGNPIPYASVSIKGMRTGIMTNPNGSFSIKPVTGWNNITLVGSSAGFELTEVLVDKKNLSDSVIIKLIEVSPAVSKMMGELIICRKPPTKKELKNVPLMPATSSDPAALVFKVFPNPVASGTNLNIEVKQTEEGYYTLQLLNQSGQSVHQQEIWIDAEARLLSIDVPPVATGSYFLVLTNKKSGKRFTKKIIIQ